MIKYPIPKHVLVALPRLRRWATSLRTLYPYPIWLVGSALSGRNPNPRDWDIRIVVSDEDFRKRFGEPHEWEIEGVTGLWTNVRWLWADECVKRTMDGWYRCHLNIDFQVYPRTHAKMLYPPSARRIRLDRRRR